MKPHALLFALSVAVLSGCRTDVPTDPTTVTIGALLPLTGAQSSYGESADAALAMAVSDVNAYFEASQASFRIAVRVEDTAGDPSQAFDELTEMANAGITLVVGPWSPDVLADLGPLARRLGVVLLTPASLTPALTDANDPFYHLIPDIPAQVESAVTRWRGQDIEALTLLARNGIWGNAVTEEVARAFVDQGGTIVATQRYDAGAGADFRTELGDLRTTVADGIEDFGTAGVAVALLAFDEAVQVCRQADAEDGLDHVAWVGLDGFVLNADLLSDAEAAGFAARVGYAASMFAGDEVDPVRQATVTDVLTTTLSRPPDMFALVGYDAVWLAALTIGEVGTTRERATIDAALRAIADVYNGASGRIRLDDDGGRTGTQYDFWTPVATTNGFAWEPVNGAADG